MWPRCNNTPPTGPTSGPDEHDNDGDLTNWEYLRKTYDTVDWCAFDNKEDAQPRPTSSSTNHQMPTLAPLAMNVTLPRPSVGQKSSPTRYYDIPHAAPLSMDGAIYAALEHGTHPSNPVGYGMPSTPSMSTMPMEGAIFTTAEQTTNPSYPAAYGMSSMLSIPMDSATFKTTEQTTHPSNTYRIPRAPSLSLVGKNSTTSVSASHPYFACESTNDTDPAEDSKPPAIDRAQLPAAPVSDIWCNFDERLRRLRSNGVISSGEQLLPRADDSSATPFLHSSQSIHLLTVMMDTQWLSQSGTTARAGHNDYVRSTVASLGATLNHEIQETNPNQCQKLSPAFRSKHSVSQTKGVSGVTSLSRLDNASAKTAGSHAGSIAMATEQHSHQHPPPMKNLLRPLTAYNYFYRTERENIVANTENPGDPLPHPICDFSTSQKEALLHQRWFVAPVKGKRRHRAVHGKIEFPREIAQHWKALPEHGKQFYREVALADKEAYERVKHAEFESSSLSSATLPPFR